MHKRGRESTAAAVLGTTYLLAVPTIAITLGWSLPSRQVLAACGILLVLYAIAYRIEYTVRFGSMVPTEPVLVVLLFTAPLAWVPLIVLVAQHLRWPLRKADGENSALAVGAGLHCLGPVLILYAFGHGPVDTGRFPVYLLALLAQFGCDAAAVVIRRIGFGDPLREVARPLGWTFLIDSCMAPIGLSAALGRTPLTSAILVMAPIALIGVLAQDRRERVEEAETLGLQANAARHEARLDELTGLANRRAWHEAVADATSRQEETGERIGIVYADLDYLKHTNDTRGHDAGDILIKAMADEFRRASRHGDIIARLGGDEFAMLIPSRGTPHNPQDLITRLQSNIASSRIQDGLTLSASIGAASCPPEPNVASAILAAEQMAIRNKVARRVGRTNVS